MIKHKTKIISSQAKNYVNFFTFVRNKECKNGLGKLGQDKDK